MKIGILGGAGAMGGLYGGRLALAGEDVTLIDVWPEAVEKINADGLIVEDKASGEKKTVKVHATTKPEEAGQVDVLMVFVKCYHTEAAVRGALPMLGAETLLSDDHLLATVLAQTNGEGAPVVIEATGNVQVMQSTAALVAAGGRVVIVGLVKEGVPVAFPGLDFTRKEMTILGSRAPVNCFPESLQLLASGAIHYPHIATEFDLWDAPQIFADLAEHPAKVHKGVLMRDINS